VNQWIGYILKRLNITKNESQNFWVCYRFDLNFRHD